MTWLVWRQYRLQFFLVAALLAAFAVLIVITGVQAANQWHACTASHGCQNLFLGSHAVGFLVIMTVGAPVLVGLFWGAPLVAAESEAGTTHFAWMQSVTRRRWFAVKVGWMLLAAAVWGSVISALVTWWEGPNNALQLDAFDTGRFDIMGIVPVGYAVFAMALGITAGVLVRRTLVAIAITLAGFIAVRSVIYIWLRPHFMSAVTTYFPLTSTFTPAGGYWQLAAGYVGAGGRPLSIPLSTNGPVIGTAAGGLLLGSQPYLHLFADAFHSAFDGPRGPITGDARPAQDSRDGAELGHRQSYARRDRNCVRL